MGLGLKFFVFLCLFLCPCNGFPTKGVRKKADSGKRFTEEEDKFLIEELTCHLDEINSPTYRKVLWNNIAEKHKEKWRKKTPGFPQERTRGSLHSRFASILIHNYYDKHVKVPDALIKKYVRTNSNRKGGGRKYPYTAAEDEFLFQELLKPSCTSIHNLSSMEAIHAEHTKKFKAKTPGFVFERTLEGLRRHLCDMRQNGKLPSEVLEKFASEIAGGRQMYSTEEDNVIIAELLKPSCNSMLNKDTIEAIHAEFQKKRQANTHGFEKGFLQVFETWKRYIYAKPRQSPMEK